MAAEKTDSLPTAWLELHFRGDQIEHVIIEPGNDFKVGRASLCNIVLQQKFVSNVHFRIYSIVFELETERLFYCQSLSKNGTLWNDRPLAKYDTVLLTDGDTLEILGIAAFQFHQPLSSQVPSNLTELLKTPQIHPQYLLTNRVLGGGGFGDVLVAENMHGKQFAIKIVDLSKMKEKPAVQEEKRRAALKETRILKELNHPNILKVHEIISTSQFFFMIQTLVPGGDLFSFVQQRGKLPEYDAMEIMWQLLTAVEFLHENGIVHRDIKLDNILLTADEKNPLVILADFGVAKFFDPNQSSTQQRTNTVIGTEEYYAPEVVRQACRQKGFQLRVPTFVPEGHTEAVDMWALGIVLCYLLVSISPFAGGASPEETYARILRCNLDVVYRGGDWGRVSMNCKAMVCALLEPNERRRITVQEAKKHVWFKRHVVLLEKCLHKAVERSGIVKL